MTPDNQSFVKYIKLISALPLVWINNDYPANGLHKFMEFKKKIISQTELLGQSNKTAFTFFKRKIKNLTNYTTTEMVQNFTNTSRLY